MVSVAPPDSDRRQRRIVAPVLRVLAVAPAVAVRTAADTVIGQRLADCTLMRSESCPAYIEVTA